MGLLHPISVGAVLCVGAALLTWGRRLLTVNPAWAELGYYNRYSMLICTFGMSFGYFRLVDFVATTPGFPSFLPGFLHWTGIAFWIVGGLMGAIGGVMVSVVGLTRFLTRRQIQR